MSTDHSENGNPAMQPLSRRDVLVALGSLGLLGIGVSAVRGALGFLTPPVSQVQPPVIVAGPPADFVPGVLTPVPDEPVFIGRDEAGLFALSAVCTHLGCTVAQGDEGLACPCHGSRFALDGTNLSGPAARPLSYLALALNDDGLVEVNLAQTVEPESRLRV